MVNTSLPRPQTGATFVKKGEKNSSDKRICARQVETRPRKSQATGGSQQQKKWNKVGIRDGELTSIISGYACKKGPGGAKIDWPLLVRHGRFPNQRTEKIYQSGPGKFTGERAKKKPGCRRWSKKNPCEDVQEIRGENRSQKKKRRK